MNGLENGATVEGQKYSIRMLLAEGRMEEMKMEEIAFFKKMGLRDNPFQFTNADEEDRLADYFVPPPYFQSVWGNPKKPSSCVVFAPRGGGKSAQRKMIEIRSRDNNVLAIQYSRFEFEGVRSVKNIDLNYHLENIVRLCLIGLLMSVHERNLDHRFFQSSEREQIRELSKLYLYDMNQAEVIGASKLIMSRFDKAKDFFARNLWAINSILTSLFGKLGLTPVRAEERTGKTRNPSKNDLEILLSMITKVGFESVYVLVDKVDETELTGNDASASFDLIAPMLKDLDLLQTEKIGFKFFLWDEIYPFYKRRARPDRISQYDLKWTKDDLKRMMILRLRAYAANHSGRLFDLVDESFFALFLPSMEDSIKKGVEDLVLTFSHGSPRDMIRICRQMVTEHLRLEPDTVGIRFPGVTNGLNAFCNERAKEVVPDSILSELQKTHRLDFTVNYVANDVFKISTNAGRSKIKTWVKTGVVKRIDDIRLGTFSKPVHHYAVTDSRVAKFIFKELDFVQFLQQKVKYCEKCGEASFGEWDLPDDDICRTCKSPL